MDDRATQLNKRLENANQRINVLEDETARLRGLLAAQLLDRSQPEPEIDHLIDYLSIRCTKTVRDYLYYGSDPNDARLEEWIRDEINQTLKPLAQR